MTVNDFLSEKCTHSTHARRVTLYRHIKFVIDQKSLIWMDEEIQHNCVINLLV